MALQRASFIVTLTLLFHISQAQEDDWISLFNGKDLSDWTPKFTGYEAGYNLNNTFRVNDGILQVNYDRWDTFNNEFGHLFFKMPYAFYRLQIEYRFVGNQLKNGPGWAFRNNGVMFHAQSVESMLKDQDFPISIEVQLLGGNGQEERPTANLCTPGTHAMINGELVEDHCVNSSAKTYHGDQWVKMDIVVLGDSIVHHIIMEDTVFTYTKPVIGGGVVANYDFNIKRDGQSLEKGFIAIQAESHPTQFRSIKLLNLEGCKDPKAKNHKPYVVKHLKEICEYE